MVCERGRGEGDRSPQPAPQFHKHMIAPAGTLPVDQLDALAE